ncbi:MAG: addiction module protein [bacterium]|nr:addiction module protein [bacterium]
MSPQLKEVENQALLLPVTDREILVQVLVHSLDNAPLTDIDEAWIQEAEKRYRDFKDGTTQGIPGDRIFADLRRELGWQS